MKILAATDFSTRSRRATGRAGMLAKATGAEFTLLHVVDDDQPQDLLQLTIREAQRVLDGQIGAIPELAESQVRAVAVAGDAFDGILRTATTMGADLIVMGAHRKQLLRDIFIGTTIERVIRLGCFPVLMVNQEPAQPYRTMLAAIDFSEHSAAALQRAMSLGMTAEGSVTLLHAFFPYAKGMMARSGVPQGSIDDYVRSERELVMDELARFVVANDLAVPGHSARVVEGRPFDVIADTVKELTPDLLVMGTHGRSGIVRALLGSVTEEALRSLEVDILAVPPMGRARRK
jgi:nucleotide-binding universal stress UspA family protein